jgi:hypothetical protein
MKRGDQVICHRGFISKYHKWDFVKKIHYPSTFTKGKVYEVNDYYSYGAVEIISDQGYKHWFNMTHKEKHGMDHCTKFDMYFMTEQKWRNKKLDNILG